jgi:MFS family permease
MLSPRVPPALRHRPFRLLWLGLAISVAGTQMQIWALFWHIRELTPEPIALGGVGMARIAPVIIFSLIGGAVADVADRRRILFVTQSAMALLALVLAVLTFRGAIVLWHIYALTACQAMAFAFDLPARQSLVPNLVPARDLPSAFSLQSIAFQSGAIVGPALSGLVIARFGQPYVYAINAVSYLAVVAALLLMGRVGEREETTRHAGVNLHAIGEGISFIRRQPMIMSTMLLDFFATFFSSANTLMPIFARDVLGVGAVAYGWLSAAQAIGALLVGVVMSQLDTIRRQGPVLLLSVVLYGLATVVFGLARAVPLAMVALIVAGGADAVSTIIRNTIRQLSTPDHIRGRMTSVNQIFFQGGPQLGEVEAGAVAQLLGAPAAIVSGGIGCLAAVAWIARRWPDVARYDTHDARTRSTDPPRGIEPSP